MFSWMHEGQYHLRHVTYIRKEAVYFFHAAPRYFANTKVDIGQRDKAESSIDKTCLRTEIGVVILQRKL